MDVQNPERRNEDLSVARGFQHRGKNHATRCVPHTLGNLPFDVQRAQISVTTPLQPTRVIIHVGTVGVFCGELFQFLQENEP